MTECPLNSCSLRPSRSFFLFGKRHGADHLRGGDMLRLLNQPFIFPDTGFQGTDMPPLAEHLDKGHHIFGNRARQSLLHGAKRVPFRNARSRQELDIVRIVPKNL